MSSKIVEATYTNWKGETSVRRFIPIEIFFGANEWHPTEQWLLKAHDVEKGAERTFAMKDFKDWKPLDGDA